MAEVLARGPNFLYAREYIIKVYGSEVWNKIVEGLPPDVREVWSGSILVTSTYPFSAFKVMLAALVKTVGAIQHRELARLYEHVADQSLSKVYKIFFKMMNPAFVIRNYPKLWERFFAAGKVEVPVAEKGHAVLRFTLPEIFLDWIYPACLGYSKKAVEMAGGSNLTLKETSKAQVPGDLWEISFELFWQE